MRKLVVLFACALCAACSVYKDYSRPELTQLDDIYGLAVGDSASLADIGWRDFFADPLLQELIGRGLDGNPDVLIAAQRVVEAEAALSAARQALFPSFGLSPSVSYGESEVRYGGGAVGYGISPAASWELDLRGSLTNSRRKAQAAYERSEVFLRSTRTALVSAIARA